MTVYQEEKEGAFRSILFACNHNAVRSVMAEGIAKYFLGSKVQVESCGVHAGEINPFMISAMEEIGIDVSGHKPRRFSELEDEDAHYDVIISLTPEAQHQAVEFTRNSDVRIPYWPTHDPTLAQGNRTQIMEAFRDVRDHLSDKIQAFFQAMPPPNA